MKGLRKNGGFPSHAQEVPSIPHLMLYLLWLVKSRTFTTTKSGKSSSLKVDYSITPIIVSWYLSMWTLWEIYQSVRLDFTVHSAR